MQAQRGKKPLEKWSTPTTLCDNLTFKLKLSWLQTGMIHDSILVKVLQGWTWLIADCDGPGGSLDPFVDLGEPLLDL